MNSTLSFSININDEKFFYENYFDENDEKSRLFDDNEKDLIEKLGVSDNISSIIYIILFKFI